MIQLETETFTILLKTMVHKKHIVARFFLRFIIIVLKIYITFINFIFIFIYIYIKFTYMN